MKDLSLSQIFALYTQINEELREREVVRSANNPTGELAEYLFVTGYGWDIAENSQKGYDATKEGVRFQIKARRVHARNSSRQLGAIRDFDGFDVLAAVIFDNDYQIERAALIPSGIVKKHSKYVAHTNSCRFIFRDSIFGDAEVVDVTEELKMKSGYYIP